MVVKYLLVFGLLAGGRMGNHLVSLPLSLPLSLSLSIPSNVIRNATTSFFKRNSALALGGKLSSRNEWPHFSPGWLHRSVRTRGGTGGRSE